MPLTATKLKRKYVFNNNELIDPNPEFSNTEVAEFYSGTYPELTNAAIKIKEKNENEIIYEFKTKISENG
jgi:PRTRC genetic system protein C